MPIRRPLEAIAQDRAIQVLAALAQETRLEAFMLLVKAEPYGIAASDLARSLSVPQNTLSSRLTILTQADLVSSKRRGRSIVYRAKLDSFHPVVHFLIQECCLGHPEACDLTKIPAQRSSSRKKNVNARSSN